MITATNLVYSYPRAAAPTLGGVSFSVAPGTVYIEGGHGATAPLGAGRIDAGRV